MKSFDFISANRYTLDILCNIDYIIRIYAKGIACGCKYVIVIIYA
jgi:hypothetical protein